MTKKEAREMIKKIPISRWKKYYGLKYDEDAEATARDFLSAIKYADVSEAETIDDLIRLLE